MSVTLAEIVRPKIGPANNLTLRVNRFIDHYLKTLNGTESARVAGWNSNDNVLAVTASRLLRNPKVVLEINRRLGKSILSANEVLEGLSLQARGDLTEVLEPDGSFNLREAKRRGVSKLLKKLKTKTHYEKDYKGDLQPVVEHEYEIHDPQAALVQLGRYHKLFTEKIEVSSPQDELKSQIIQSIADKYSISKEKASELVQDVCGDDLLSE